MVTYQQYIRGARRRKLFKSATPRLGGAPFKNGICKRVYIEKPKKPNSAKRAVAKVKLSNGRKLIAYIPGFGHRLGKNDEVMVRGGRVPDLPGVRYHILRNKKRHIEPETVVRAQRRSKFGLKNPNIKRDAFVLTMRGRNRQRKRARIKLGRVMPRRVSEYRSLPEGEVADSIKFVYTDGQLRMKRQTLYSLHFFPLAIRGRLHIKRACERFSSVLGICGKFNFCFRPRSLRTLLRKSRIFFGAECSIKQWLHLFVIFGVTLLYKLCRLTFKLLLLWCIFAGIVSTLWALYQCGCFDWFLEISSEMRQQDNLQTGASLDDILEQPLVYVFQDLYGYLFDEQFRRPESSPLTEALELAELINANDPKIVAMAMRGILSKSDLHRWRSLTFSVNKVNQEYLSTWTIWRIRRLRLQYFEERKLFAQLTESAAKLSRLHIEIKNFLAGIFK